ncbi:Endo-1,3(4)-beta-glucanase [Penicillium ucsense]|uniref:endo-1,3(4)-beta-glucanase n=1 Tax=Penicillium ucsense TaxID=2839758 RepID=A0A8J8VWB8_9EURO|nr:Endo-1,3(4)-beta-glucanase [Penicillium ucsense]KAF7730324.1 Endo-1,3(4)-beta-glucanase [Penicillium ucsense]
MHVLSTLLSSLGLLAQITRAAYTLQEDYGTTDSFFDKFDFFTDADPTNGYVSYVDRSTARNAGLIRSTGSSVYIGVDTQNQASGSGRQSVRLTSTKSYQHGLVILDLAHMPGSVCGTWPAFWMLGANWPNNGEIDIIEGVNTQSNNQVTLHTSNGCSIQNSGFTGLLDTANCYVEAAGQSANSGCAITSNSGQSYGDGFNQAGGGVYATEWTSAGIKVWFFPRSGIPWDISIGKPNPATWGMPTAAFAGSCNIDSHFNNLQLVFDITFCGDWAGNVWSSGTCAYKAPTCNSFVQNNPAAFKETYWSVNSLKVYQDNGSPLLSVHAHAAAHIGAKQSISQLVSRRGTAPYIRPGPRPEWREHTH